MKIIFLILFFCLGCDSALSESAIYGFATWYSRESSRREGTGGKRILMASGHPLCDEVATCAIPMETAKAWNMKFGQSLRVTNLEDGRMVVVIYADTGPGRRSRSKGVIVDLSVAAMRAVAGEAGLKAGRVKVRIEKLK